MSSALVEAREVSRRYGRRWAVRRFSASFEAGTVTAVVGHNGSGKSTLMAMLAGVRRPTEGEVRVFGEDVFHHPEPARMRSRLGVLRHEPFVYPDLDGYENLRFFAKVYGHPADDERLREVLVRVDLELAARRVARTYSRGMVQRLALARMLVQGPEVWLMDEPTTGLDTAGRAVFVQLLSELRQAGRCVVAVTHDLALLEPVADAVLTLENGRLVDA